MAFLRKNPKRLAVVLCWVCFMGTKGCLLSFPDYPAADVCAARLDAGIAANNAPDPVLRGCDGGADPPADGQDPTAGAAGMDGQ